MRQRERTTERTNNKTRIPKQRQQQKCNNIKIQQQTNNKQLQNATTIKCNNNNKQQQQTNNKQTTNKQQTNNKQQNATTIKCNNNEQQTSTYQMVGSLEASPSPRTSCVDAPHQSIVIQNTRKIHVTVLVTPKILAQEYGF